MIEIQFFDEKGCEVETDSPSVTVITFPPLLTDQQELFHAMLRGERIWSIEHSIRVCQ